MTGNQLARPNSGRDPAYREACRQIRRAGHHRTAATAELHDLKRHLIRMYAVTAAEWEAGQ